jgi:branched-chain amino acid transport system permease protein
MNLNPERTPVNPRFDWSVPIRSGLLGGIIAVFLALTGMIEASNQRPVIYGVLSMGWTLLLSVFLIFAYQAARQAMRRAAGKQSAPWLLLSGALAGLIIAAMLAALVCLGQVVNLRAVFIHASPELYNLLTFGLGIPAGIFALLGVGIVLGVLSATLRVLPDRVGRSIMIGLVLIPLLATTNSALFAGRGLSVPAAVIVFLVGAIGSYLWSGSQARVKQQIAALPPTRRRVLTASTWGLAAVIVLLLPLLGSYPSEVLNLVGIYLLMGLGLNIVVGFAGLLDLGYVAFFAIGAYTMGVLTSPEIHWLPFRLTFWEALPFAILAALLSGVILGIPVLQMRGDYLAIVTLGFGEIVRLVVLSDWLKSFIGGSNGITLIPKAAIGPLKLATPSTLYYLILLGCLVAAFVAIRLKDSRLGRNWMAMREDEDVAQAMGIDLVKNKLLAFGTGAAFGGLSGAIFATKVGSIYPQSFNFLVSINVLALIIVGGMGSIPGVIVGALVLVGMPELLREFAEYRLLVYGAALMFMMLFRPEGLVPEARRRLELHEAESDMAE